jgi:hypothetical protein
MYRSSIRGCIQKQKAIALCAMAFLFNVKIKIAPQKLTK